MSADRINGVLQNIAFEDRNINAIINFSSGIVFPNDTSYGMERMRA